MVKNPFIAAGALSALLAVAAGAFGAHALKQRLPPDLLAVFEVGVRYQMYHAVALLFLGLLGDRAPLSPVAMASGWLFLSGTLLFSGSLYVLALFGARWLGAITPLGGLCFLAGWALLVVFALRRSPAS